MQKPTTVSAALQFPLIVVVENDGISTNSNAVVPNGGNWLT